ncbi:uncharacterized protein N0V89_003252 [Didymosphaeria variabile]|uniref:Uncharacterized protein n=1 Tax=Didymosphaeria variabile TaxID=1932322 RepID=A0A9W8XVR3_9PLEO|nr:uncharacterized protein N0V89_003252 [Didymosphaeria variabile]KAJ4358668.1 hypothetical protein N0V89_003252 [Didymosphaeria variabile]
MSMTSLLIQWPAALTRFEFGSLLRYPYILDYPMFESWLLIHKDTLKHVAIGHLSERGDRRLFNATLFPHLEYLRLSRWQMSQVSVEFQADDANILGPSLKTFCWDFRVFDEHNEDWHGFGKTAALWVEKIISEAVAREAVLKTFQIQFKPRYGDTELAWGYPWDWMVDLRERVFKPTGMGLVYSEPRITKEQWLEWLKRPDRKDIEEEEYERSLWETDRPPKEEDKNSEGAKFESWYQ